MSLCRLHQSYNGKIKLDRNSPFLLYDPHCVAR